MAEADSSQTMSRNQSSNRSNHVSTSKKFFKTRTIAGKTIKYSAGITPLVDAPVTLTEPNNEQANRHSTERGPAELRSVNGEIPVKRFITAAARKQYVHTNTDNLVGSLNTLIVQAASTTRRVEQLNLETQSLLSNLNGILRVAHQQIQLCTYVLILFFYFFRGKHYHII